MFHQPMKELLGLLKELLVLNHHYLVFGIVWILNVMLQVALEQIQQNFSSSDNKFDKNEFM
jgi:hypothetical protein